MSRFCAVVWAFLVRDTLIALSYRLEFAMRIATVVFHVTAVYFLSSMIGQNDAVDGYGGYLPFAAIGLAVISITQAGFNSFAKAIHAEQLHGTIEALLLAPLRLGTVVVACSSWTILWHVLVSFAYVAAAVGLYDTELQGSLLLALMFLALATIASASLGIVSASFVLVYKRGDPVAMLMGGVSFLLGGVFYPVTSMPEWLRNVAYCLPITHGLRGVREVLLRGAGVGELWPQVTVLCGFVAIGLPIGLTCFRYAVRRAQREGSLLHF